MPLHCPPLHLLLTGPGRIGAGLEPRLRADGHTVRILTRADYGDFADPAFDPHPTVDALPADPAPDAILHLAGLFQIGPAADPDRLLRANAHGPIALAEALHARFPHAQHILFLDAREVFTPVSRRLNEWSTWQLRNLAAIVRLYRGRTDDYARLLADYRAAIGVADDPFPQAKAAAEAALAKTRADAAADLAKQKGKAKREAKATWERREAEAKARVEAATQACWLTERFGEEGAYRDVPGLCKAATRAEIAAKNHSLTPGVYVGVPETPPEEEGRFAERMAAIHAELAELSAKAEGLMAAIQRNAREWAAPAARADAEPASPPYADRPAGETH